MLDGTWRALLGRALDSRDGTLRKFWREDLHFWREDIMGQDGGKSPLVVYVASSYVENHKGPNTRHSNMRDVLKFEFKTPDFYTLRGIFVCRISQRTS